MPPSTQPQDDRYDFTDCVELHVRKLVARYDQPMPCIGLHKEVYPYEQNHVKKLGTDVFCIPPTLSVHHPARVYIPVQATDAFPEEQKKEATRARPILLPSTSYKEPVTSWDWTDVGRPVSRFHLGVLRSIANTAPSKNELGGWLDFAAKILSVRFAVSTSSAVLVVSEANFLQLHKMLTRVHPPAPESSDLGVVYLAGVPILGLPRVPDEVIYVLRPGPSSTAITPFKSQPKRNFSKVLTPKPKTKKEPTE